MLRIATQAKPVHEIAYCSKFRRFRQHYLVTEAFKILRLWDASPEDRYIPAGESGRGLPLDLYKELGSNFHGLPPQELDDLSQFLYHSTTTLLTNIPVDPRVERELFDALPQHKACQEAYLRSLVEHPEPTIIPELAPLCPNRVCVAITGMDIVKSAEAAELAGLELPSVFAASPHYVLGKRLRKHLRSVGEGGHSGDRMVTDLWATELGMEGWYEWARMEEFEDPYYEA